MDLKDLGRVADYLIRCGLDIKTNTADSCIEVMDANGAVHLYYPEKQLATFRRHAFFSDDERNLGLDERNVANLPLNKFAYVCKHPEVLKW